MCWQLPVISNYRWLIFWLVCIMTTYLDSSWTITFLVDNCRIGCCRCSWIRSWNKYPCLATDNDRWWGRHVRPWSWYKPWLLDARVPRLGAHWGLGSYHNWGRRLSWNEKMEWMISRKKLRNYNIALFLKYACVPNKHGSI